MEEGEQYRVGEVRLEGLSVFREEGIRPYFALVPGAVYDESKVRKGLLELRELYGKHGYFQFTGAPQRIPDANSKRVDLVLRFTEDKRYFVGKIHFSGNEISRDRVIRRALFLNEGEVFDASALRKSIRRIASSATSSRCRPRPSCRSTRSATTRWTCDSVSRSATAAATCCLTLSMSANTTGNIVGGRYVYDTELTSDNAVIRIIEVCCDCKATSNKDINKGKL